MSMISELVKRLRVEAILMGDAPHMATLLHTATDTIEMLSEKARGQEWIPCSERLPKSYVEVLVCDDCGWINLGAYRPCDISEDCSGWSIHAHTKIGTEEVVAWMPLPEPWKGVSDDSKYTRD